MTAQELSFTFWDDKSTKLYSNVIQNPRRPK